MIRQIYFYSEAVSKENKCYFSIGKMVLQIFSFIILYLLFILTVIEVLNDNPLADSIFFVGLIVFCILLILYSIKISMKMRARITAFASDLNDNLYFVRKENNGESFAIGSLAAGNLLNSKLDNHLAGNAVKTVGTAATLYTFNQSFKIMSNPEIISKLLENYQEATGVVIGEILNIHSITLKGNKIKIVLDYKMMKTGVVKYNKKMTIYKAYTCFDEFVNLMKLKNFGGENNDL